MAFVRTDTILDTILTQKQVEVESLRQRPDRIAELEAEARHRPPPLDFISALRKDTVALIAEVKKASPSKGILVADFDPLAIAQTYAGNGAAAISVLTDERFFQGSLAHLQTIRSQVDLPLLRKDFIIDPLQVLEARAAGADAVLLIVMALEDDQLVDLHALIHELGMAALVEVHNEAELDRALAVGATLIGVNNRDLRTFSEDLGTTERLANQLRDNRVTLVAESAMRSLEDVRRMGDCGVQAVLIGEGLVRAPDRAAAVRSFSSQPRRNRMIS
jgi:indole-3-glycerol phosphate synthase